MNFLKYYFQKTPLQSNRKLNLRFEIERLVIILMPVLIFRWFVSGILPVYLRKIVEMGIETPGSSIHRLTLYTNIIESVDNIAVGLWIYFLAKKENNKPLIWLFFAFYSPLFSVVAYIALKIYEDQSSFNKALNSDRATASRSQT